MGFDKVIFPSSLSALPLLQRRKLHKLQPRRFVHDDGFLSDPPSLLLSLLHPVVLIPPSLLMFHQGLNVFVSRVGPRLSSSAVDSRICWRSPPEESTTLLQEKRVRRLPALFHLSGSPFFVASRRGRLDGDSCRGISLLCIFPAAFFDLDTIIFQIKASVFCVNSLFSLKFNIGYTVSLFLVEH